MVLRDHQRGFTKVRVLRQRGELIVFEGEVRVMLAVLKLTSELNVSDITFESDSMFMLQVLSNITNYLEVGTIIQKCQNLLRERPDFSISFVRKQVNTIAHLLTRISCIIDCFHDFSSPS